MVQIASPLLRRGICSIIDESDGMSVVEHANDSGNPATGAAQVCIWDAALDDADWSGASALADVGIAVLVIARDGKPIDLSELLRAGACGVVDRDVAEATLVSAVIAAADGRAVLAAGRPGALWEQAASGARGAVPALTRRELQVLQLMGRGLTNRAIADELFISENTVKNHVRHVHEKLQVRSRTEAVVRAAEEGIVEIASRGPV